MKITSRDDVAAKGLLVTEHAWKWTCLRQEIGPMHDPVTWYKINYTGKQITQWDFQNKGTRTSPARLSFASVESPTVLFVCIIYSVPYDRIVRRAYWPLDSRICNRPRPGFF